MCERAVMKPLLCMYADFIIVNGGLRKIVDRERDRRVRRVVVGVP